MKLTTNMPYTFTHMKNDYERRNSQPKVSRSPGDNYLHSHLTESHTESHLHASFKLNNGLDKVVLQPYFNRINLNRKKCLLLLFCYSD